MAKELDPRTQALVRLLLGAGLIVVAFGLLIWQNRWIRSVLAGPVPISLGDLAKLKDPGTLANPWVKIQYTNAVLSPLEMIETKNGRETARNKFLLIQAESRYLIAEVPGGHQGTSVTGYLDTWWTPLRRESIQKLKQAHPAEGARFLPYQFDASYDYRTQCFAMVGIVVAMLLIGGWLGVSGLLGLRSSPQGGVRNRSARPPRPPSRRSRDEDDEDT